MNSNDLVREKAVMYGESSLSEKELVSLICGEDQSRCLFTTFGDLHRISTASVRELQKIRGIGIRKALQLKACMEIAKRFHQIPLRSGVILSSSQQVFAHYHVKLRDEQKEKFFSLLLDTKHRVIKEELVSIGSLNFSIVHPREVFAPAIREHAESIILIHNHPSGDPTPSKEDIHITGRLREVGKLVGIDVLDHVIIGNNSYTSFVEQSLL